MVSFFPRVKEDKYKRGKMADEILEQEKKDIVWLEEINKESIDIAGGKGANLAEMFNAGMPVPPAFIITAQAYHEFICSAGLDKEIYGILNTLNIDDTTELEKKSGEIREMIVSEEMLPALRKKIESAYDILSTEKEFLNITDKNIVNMLKAGEEPAFVAVRSSATTEDLKTASFAGQQETFLNVKGKISLIESVKKCWASLFTARSIFYRQKNKFKHETSYVAVVVQKMVNSDKAGVMFTLNPLTNTDEIVIEACYGLGEGVVSGAVAPDYYSVDKSNLRIIKKELKKQSVQLIRDSSGKTIKAKVTAGMKGRQVLSDNEIRKLAEHGIKIEKHYNAPQDIEFAVEGSNIYIVQSRPVTTAEKEIKATEEIKTKLLLEGLAASPGIGKGFVKIVNSIDDLSKVTRGDILVTKMTNPDMVVTMQRSAGIVTDEGGATAHAAIVSREMGLPCVVGTMKATAVLKENQFIIIDGSNGKVYEGTAEQQQQTRNMQQGPVSQQSYASQQESQEKQITSTQQKQSFSSFSTGIKKAETVPQVYVPTKTHIYMNLGEPEKIEQYKNLFFDGIGLMRIEFIIASSIGEHPLYLIEKGESQKYIDKLVEGITRVAKTISPKPVVVRFSDFKTNEYKDLTGGEKYEGHEDNPMIGFRGVSRYISEQFKEAFRLECRAIKKVRESCRNVWIMLPFVRTKSEVEKCIEIMSEEGLERSDNFRIWLMAEVPAMAIIPEEFAQLNIDGVSIGSNDLTQLVLGVDRDSALLGRMGYFDERNPAVLKAIENIIKNFHYENKTVSICGQAPSVYPEIVEFLVKHKADSISVNPDAVNSVRQNVAKIEKQYGIKSAYSDSSERSERSERASARSEQRGGFDKIKPFEKKEIDSLAEMEDDKFTFKEGLDDF